MEGATFAQLTLHPDFSLHQFYEPAANGQAQTRAAVPSRRRAVGLGKRLKNCALVLMRDSNTGVFDLKVQGDRIGGEQFLTHGQQHIAAVGINLMALPTRLYTIRRMRPGSPSSATGISGATS
jgi:hypothetical protein